MFALIGLLVLGASMLVSASTVTGSMMRLFNR
jgi:hypothetical protein